MTFEKANSTQLYYRDLCLKNATENSSEYKSVTIRNERVSPLKGELTFFLSREAKENTGLLCLTDKTWFVRIGRRGRVGSTLMYEKKVIEKNNKYCTF